MCAQCRHRGRSIALGFKRTRTFWNRKKILVSTPTIRGQCREEKAFQATDQRRFSSCVPSAMNIRSWNGVT